MCMSFKLAFEQLKYLQKQSIAYPSVLSVLFKLVRQRHHVSYQAKRVPHVANKSHVLLNVLTMYTSKVLDQDS